MEHLKTHRSYNFGSASTGLIPALDTASPASLSARERRAMLEDIGHVTLVLGRALRPDHASSDANGDVPASPAPARVDALTSPLERLHFLCGLWTHLFGALNEIARQPDSRMTSTQRQISLARSRGGAAAATTLARSPASAAAWQTLQAAQPHPPRFARRGTPAQVSRPRVVKASTSSAHDANKGRIAESPDSDKPDAHMSAGERALIAEPALTSTQNTWANRMVVSLLEDMAQEAKALARLAAFCDDEAACEQAARLADGAGRLLAGAILRGCPALRAEEHDPPFAADLIARCAPMYGVVYHGWRALHHPLDFDWTHAPMLALPSLEAWHLYEIWCCLQVGAALLRAGWQVEAANAQAAGASAYSLLRCTPQGLRLNMATGRASRLCFRKIESGRRGQDMETLDLYYQPLFASANQAAFQQVSRQSFQQTSSQQTSGTAFSEPSPTYQHTDHEDRASAFLPPVFSSDPPDARRDDPMLAFASRSHAMQPDIALHRRGALTLLDPKYKRYAQPSDAQDDINKMHAYRDAIMTRTARGCKGAMRTSGVTAAWCLFPGTGAQNPDAYGAQPGEKHDEGMKATQEDRVYAYPTPSAEHPFGTAGVGAFGLRPGQPDTLPRLAAFLTVLLNAE